MSPGMHSLAITLNRWRFLKEAVPTVSQVAFVYDPATRRRRNGQGEACGIAEPRANPRCRLSAPTRFAVEPTLKGRSIERPGDIDALLLENSVVTSWRNSGSAVWELSVAFLQPGPSQISVAPVA